MPRLKYFNNTTQEWEYVIVGGQGPQGDTGPGLAAGGTAGQIIAKIDGTDYNTEWIDNYATQTKHEVKLAESINAGQAVYVSSANGTNMIVSKASNNAEAYSSKTMGLIEASGVTNDFVKVVTEGLLSGINTSSATAGDPVWLGTNGDLVFGLANKPVAPAHMVYLGVVTRAHASEGEIFVHVQNGFELDELHDVSITSPAAGELVARNSANSLWENMTLAEAGVSEVGHTHDDRYYTETETDNAISTAIANIVDTAPQVLDTLNELSSALNDDPNFATTVTNALAALVPSGTIMQTARLSAPSGYLMCDGSAVSRSTYSSLFDAIGTAYGTGDGSTTFNVPDLRGRVPVGKNSGTFANLGATGGSETHTLSINEMPSHTHTQDAHGHVVSANSFAGDRQIAVGPLGGDGDKYSFTDSGNDASTTTGNIYARNTTATNQNTGGGLAHNNLQPYVVVNHMIKI